MAEGSAEDSYGSHIWEDVLSLGVQGCSEHHLHTTPKLFLGTSEHHHSFDSIPRNTNLPHQYFLEQDRNVEKLTGCCCRQ